MKNRENVSKYPARSLETSISNLETGRKVPQITGSRETVKIVRALAKKKDFFSVDCFPNMFSVQIFQSHFYKTLLMDFCKIKDKIYCYTF